MVLDADNKTFVVHVAIREQEEMPMHSKRQAHVGVLLFDKTPTEVSAKYSDYSNVFSVENKAELLEHTEMNDHAIELEESK